MVAIMLQHRLRWSCAAKSGTTQILLDNEVHSQVPNYDDEGVWRNKSPSSSITLLIKVLSTDKLMLWLRQQDCNKFAPPHVGRFPSASSSHQLNSSSARRAPSFQASSKQKVFTLTTNGAVGSDYHDSKTSYQQRAKSVGQECVKQGIIRVSSRQGYVTGPPLNRSFQNCLKP